MYQTTQPAQWELSLEIRIENVTRFPSSRAKTRSDTNVKWFLQYSREDWGSLAGNITLRNVVMLSNRKQTLSSLLTRSVVKCFYNYRHPFSSYSLSCPYFFKSLTNHFCILYFHQYCLLPFTIFFFVCFFESPYFSAKQAKYLLSRT